MITDVQTTVAVLCCARNSVYKSIAGVDDRDARTFPGGMPIIAHPPCRSWSAYCAHQAKPLPGERELALWCCEQLKEHGGVLEQPAHSRLFAAGGLPMPGQSRNGLCTWYVNQSWWGFKTQKKTWLCFSKVDSRSIQIPFGFTPTRSRQRWNTQSKNQRAATCRTFAEWLIEIARRAG